MNQLWNPLERNDKLYCSLLFVFRGFFYLLYMVSVKSKSVQKETYPRLDITIHTIHSTERHQRVNRFC